MNQKIIANINNLTETGTSRIPVNTTKTELIEDFSQGEIIPGLSIQGFLDKVEKARQTKVNIKLHPNGFLQLPLDSGDKRLASLQLHIWNEAIERRGSERYQIHDHAFDIESYVITGGLEDKTYYTVEDKKGEYLVFQGDGAGQLVSNNTRVSLVGGAERITKAGESYIIKKGDFHSSNKIVPNTATLIRKTNIDPNYNSKVIVPIDDDIKKVEVNRDVDQTIAWKLVDDIVDLVKNRK